MFRCSDNGTKRAVKLRKTITPLLIAVMSFGFHACATVSTPPEPVEAPVSKDDQMKAQQEISRPESKRYKLKVAVGRFSNETTYGKALLAYEDFERFGRQTGDMLASRLIRSGEFLVFERPDIEVVRKEQQYVSDSGLVGVDTLIIGALTEFGRSDEGELGFLSKTKVQVARAKVEVRLIDVKTGHAFFSATGAGEAKSESGEIAGFGSRAAYDAALNDKAIGAAVSDLVDHLINELKQRQWRTDILDIRDGRIYISGGQRQGLKAGDILQVMQRGDVIKSKQTGFDIALPSIMVGSLRVISFFGDSEVSEGSICELVEGAIDGSVLINYYVAEAQ